MREPSVLFVCAHNAGRSQMAAGLLDHHAGGRVIVRSAGTTPADEINPAVVAAMEKIGIDLSKEYPKPLTTGDGRCRHHDGCGDACPVFPGKRYLDWDLPDQPVGRSMRFARSVTRSIAPRACRWPSCRTSPRSTPRSPILL